MADQKSDAQKVADQKGITGGAPTVHHTPNPQQVSRPAVSTAAPTEQARTQFNQNPEQSRQTDDGRTISAEEQKQRDSVPAPASHPVVVDPSQQSPRFHLPALRYDLSELVGNIRDAAWFTAFKRIVALLNDALNGGVPAAASRPGLGRPGGVNPARASAMMLPSTPDIESDVQKHVEQLKEWCERVEDQQPAAAMAMSSERHAAKATVTASDVQLLLSLLLRVMGVL